MYNLSNVNSIIPRSVCYWQQTQITQTNPAKNNNLTLRTHGYLRLFPLLGFLQITDRCRNKSGNTDMASNAHPRLSPDTVPGPICSYHKTQITQTNPVISNNLTLRTHGYLRLFLLKGFLRIADRCPVAADRRNRPTFRRQVRQC